MADELKPGDHVEWDTSQGTTEGTVERKLTGETHVKGFTAKASPDDPEFLVKSDKSGAEAAHKPGELRQRRGAGTTSGAKKTPAKRGAAKRPAATKPAAKKPAAKKPAAKKSAATRAPAKKSVAKRGAAKQAAARAR